MKVQLNFQVSKGLAAKFRADARRNNKSLDDIGEVILGDFFKAWTKTERARFYEQLPAKVSGRKISQ
jgi:hypothetical protein